jgi:hypothetical protein
MSPVDASYVRTAKVAAPIIMVRAEVAARPVLSVIEVGSS